MAAITTLLVAAVREEEQEAESTEKRSTQIKIRLKCLLLGLIVDVSLVINIY